MKKLQRKKWKCRENDIEAVHNNKDYAYQRKLDALEEVKKGYFPIKRAIDLILSIVLLFLTLPIMVIFAIAIVIDSPGNPIYSQVRVGKMGKLIK
ncbi:sugar transferase, partial [Staphylococcus aureus]|nr:sugar transferase [Staphylococcus aureus]